MTIVKDDPLLLEYRNCRDFKKKRRLADRLVRENQLLVARLVTKFSRFAPHGVEHDDLMQAGYLAFLYTIDHIDMSKTFSTYFAYRVWFEISKVVEKAGIISHPRGRAMPWKVRQRIERFETQHGRKPTPEELGVTPQQWARWQEIPSTTSLDDTVLETPDDALTPEDALAKREQENCLAWEELSEGQEQALREIFLKEKDPAAVAEELGIPLAWLESTKESGLARLREDLILERPGGVFGDPEGKRQDGGVHTRTAGGT